MLSQNLFGQPHDFLGKQGFLGKANRDSTCYSADTWVPLPKCVHFNRNRSAFQVIEYSLLFTMRERAKHQIVCVPGVCQLIDTAPCSEALTDYRPAGNTNESARRGIDRN